MPLPLLLTGDPCLVVRRTSPTGRVCGTDADHCPLFRVAGVCPSCFRMRYFTHNSAWLIKSAAKAALAARGLEGADVQCRKARDVSVFPSASCGLQWTSTKVQDPHVASRPVDAFPTSSSSDRPVIVLRCSLGDWRRHAVLKEAYHQRF
jgi:hypothetical protein